MKRNWPLTNQLAAATVALCASATAHADFNYSNFTDVSSLTLNGNAAQVADALRLSSATGNSSGSAFTTAATSLGSLNSFSTYFQFRITDSGGIGDGDGAGADGLAFVIQTVSNTVGGIGGSIGYGGITNSVGIEFDTYDNGIGYGDPDGNHVGIDVNGNIASLNTASESTRFNNGEVWNAWVDYNGSTNLLEVRWSQNTSRPAFAQLSNTVDLVATLGQNTAYLGFTSATGSGWGNHDILSWQYRDSFSPITAVPEPSIYASMMLGIGIIGFASRRRASRK